MLPDGNIHLPLGMGGNGTCSSQGNGGFGPLFAMYELQSQQLHVGCAAGAEALWRVIFQIDVQSSRDINELLSTCLCLDGESFPLEAGSPAPQMSWWGQVGTCSQSQPASPPKGNLRRELAFFLRKRGLNM